MSALITFFLALLVSWTLSFFNAAQADWFHNKDKDGHKPPKASQTYAPPPADAMEARCGELRRKIGAINSSSGVAKTLKIPQREWLLARNKKCIQSWGEQEYQYLRNADIRSDSASDNAETQSSQK